MKSSNSQSPAMSLSALVDLQTQPLKRIFPLSHPKLSVQFQFLRTCQPLYLKLHINYQMWPHAYSFFFSPLSTLSSSPSPHLPPRPVARFTPHVAASTGGRIHGDRPFPTPAAGLQAAELLPLPSRRLLRTGAEAAAALLPLSAERQGRRRRGGGATGEAAARRRSDRGGSPT
jgi:hypothetical protein